MKLYWDNAGEWDEVEKIITFPVPQIRMDAPSQVVVEIRDFEGALYTTWNTRNFVDMKVTDGAETPTTLYRGFIDGLKFLHDKTTITIAGFSKKLEQKPLNKSYILAQGVVELVPYDDGDITGLESDIVPDGEGAVAWSKTDATNWQSVESVDSDNIFAVNGLELAIDNFDFVDDTNVVTCTSLTVSIYAENQATTSDDCQVDVFWNGGWEGYKTINVTTTTGWRTSASFNVADGDHVAALQVRVKAPSVIPVDTGLIKIYAVKVTLSFTGNSDSIIGLQDTQEPSVDFNWVDDLWHVERDTGILIEDNTKNIEYKTWYAEEEGAPGDYVTDGVYVEGDHESLNAVDIDRYHAEDTTTPWDMAITPIMSAAEGEGIPDTLRIQKIEIDWRWGCRTEYYAGVFDPLATWTLEYSNDGEDWKEIKSFSHDNMFLYSEWFGEETYIIPGTHDELKLYLNIVDNEYVSFKHLRMKLTGASGGTDGHVLIEKLVMRVYYAAIDISLIMEQIDDNGASWIAVNGVDWSESGVVPGDNFKIGENTTQILFDIDLYTGININIQSTLTKYIAQWFKGTYSIEVLKKVCLLEGLHWWEDHQNYQIIVSKEADFEDSGVDLTQADYQWEWEFEGDSNQYKTVEVFGSAALRIYYKATDEDPNNTSPLIKSINEETVLTIPEAKEIAETQLLEFKVKRPSIKIVLNGLQPNLGVGKTVGLTMVRPTKAEVQYVIRMIQRSKFGIDGIATIIWCGLGKSTLAEKRADFLNKMMYLIHKAQTDRQVTTPLGLGASLSWGDIGGAQSAVEALIAIEGHPEHGELVGLVDDDHPQYHNTARANTWLTTTALSGDYVTTSGAISDYPAVSGDYAALSGSVWDYPALSGDYVDTKLDYLNVSGDYVDTSGMVNDYPTVSGIAHAEAHDLASHTTKAHQELTDYNAEANVKHLTDAQISALHAAVTEVYNLRALDDRDFKPNTANTYKFIKAYFTSLGGMTGEADSDYQDLLILNTYSDGTGGDINALTFDKSAKLIKHWLADQGAATWGSPEILAYISNIDTLIAAHHDAGSTDHDDRYYTEIEIGNKVFEQSAAFPGAPSEGDLHYDEDLDSWYRYNGEAEAWVEVGVGGLIAAETDNLGNHTATQDLELAGHDIISSGTINIKPNGDPDDYWVMHTHLNLMYMYQIGSDEANEHGQIGTEYGAANHPLWSIHSHFVYNDDGIIEEYSEVDDLQLLRDVKTWNVRQKIVNEKYPEFTQKVFDVDTLPWVKAHPNINALESGDNEKRYSSTVNQKVGYLLSTMKKMLEKIDMLENKIEELKK